MKTPGSARNFERVLTLLAERGQDLHLAFDSMGDRDSRRVVDRLVEQYPNLTVGQAPREGPEAWRSLARAVRLALDYLRYLDPRFTGAPALRKRARASAPAPIPQLASLPLVRSRPGIRALSALLRAIERAIPNSPAVAAYLAERRPDLVLVTPLVGLGSRQADYVLGARAVGIPVFFCAHSWDNLTNKGMVRGSPDRVAVWNDAQRREAVELHGIPEDHVVVTGAHSFDHWFDWMPTRSRQEFAARVGLLPDRPFLLYTCSSPFIAPDEVGFFRRWLEALRSSGDSRLAEVGVLVRPHPQNAAQWSDVQFDDGQVSIWPRAGANPLDTADRADYFESIHYAAAVVGINSSSLIEAAILGRRVHTVLDEQFRRSQTGTLHFQLLLDPSTGFLRTASSFDEHLEQLGDALAAGDEDQPNHAFLEAFVRPAGLDVPAAPLLADAVEELAESGPTRPLASSPFHWLARPLLWPLAQLARRQRRRAKAVRVAGAAAARAQERAATAEPESLDAVDQARATLSGLAAQDGPIIAGPFLSEVGYELLYWLPFLSWTLECEPDLRERITVVSRGGAAPWYRHLGVRYADVYDVMTPAELREFQDGVEDANRGSRKQMTGSAPERRLLDQLAERDGLGRPLALHPSVMFQAYWSLLKSGRLFRPKQTCFRYEGFQRPELPAGLEALPDEYVAVRFYFNPGFPDTPENRDFVRGALERLSESTTVVLLSPPMRFDDHADLEIADSPAVIRLDQAMTARNNLEVQTAAISRASAFVGTYGGLSYLPLFLGVPALAFYSDHARFRVHHLEIAQRIAREEGFGRFLALDTADSSLVRLALGMPFGDTEAWARAAARGPVA
jgi:hypothetical protein